MPLPGHLVLEFDHVTKDYACTGHAVLMGLHSVFYRTLLSKKKKKLKLTLKKTTTHSGLPEPQPGPPWPPNAPIFLLKAGGFVMHSSPGPK